MRHHKLILFGIVLVGVVVFGFLFWDDLKFNQQELSNTPLNVTTPSDNAVPASGNAGSSVSQSDDYESLERDLDQTSLEIDSDMAELESELQGL